MNLIEPWCTVSLKQAEELTQELKRELPDGHLLAPTPVKCLGKREDQDDVLFKLMDGSNRLAVVHLTWRRETDPRWPSTTIYESESDWRIDNMEARIP